MDIDKTLGHYKIISAIGKDRMDEVFLVQDTKLNRKVVLKLLPPEFTEDKNRMSFFAGARRNIYLKIQSPYNSSINDLFSLPFTFNLSR